jgi:ribosome-binding protein aMBF1 (putative translation factor)
MTPTSWSALKTKRLSAMTVTQRADYVRVYAEARLAAEVGERIREAREAAGLSQRELARRMGTSQAAIGRLEAGGVGPRSRRCRELPLRSGSRSTLNFVRLPDRNGDTGTR